MAPICSKHCFEFNDDAFEVCTKCGICSSLSEMVHEYHVNDEEVCYNMFMDVLVNNHLGFEIEIEKEYSKNSNDPRFFWSTVLEIMNIKVVNKSKNIIQIPNSGPLLMISNHPFGIIDGLVLCSLASKIRSDFKIIIMIFKTFNRMTN